ncbi:hypothetical protein FOWG_16661 [Fusarium oxysporum f. sp. lycopersici MN25]|uniref:Uncharacterized protein n=2 Tax=Fusarium oxysporum Fo47 TaxID=660027 RepID=W9KP50_FUSOX|nr:hypothetical protein FOZG_02346 [Fusarium oxysporum Fo47]EWZ79144.1 hypothetical protein FOWG_16661 [Fusarium oxysporum f. sp. lycopersici MN25]
MCRVNCSSHPTEIQAYGDVAGIGVMLAFVITAWIVVFMLIVYYLVAYNPELDPFRKEDEQTTCRYPNPVDFIVLRFVRHLPGLRNIQESHLLQSNRLESALNNCVITLSDIQIFTGISILISGYIALKCGLSSYHWQLIVYLAWLANVTHLATLSFLRNYLMNRPYKRLWRLVFMFCTLILLSVAVGLTGHFEWESGSQKPADFAYCYFGMPLDTKTVAFESMLKMVLLIAYGFFIRIAKMSRTFERWLRKMGATWRTKSTKRQRGDSRGTPAWNPLTGKGVGRLKIILVAPLLVAFFTLVNVHLDLFTSFLAEVYWVTFALIWGTKRLFYNRKLGPGEENEWTFGQTLPLVLLIAPLAAIVEQFSSSSSKPTKSTEREGRMRSRIDAGWSSWSEVEDVGDDAMIGIDRTYVYSISYQGLVFLAALSYIEAGVFFVVDDLKGISQPFQSFAFSFFVFNSTLQVFWILCTLWISIMDWSNPLQRSARAILLLSLAATSIIEFLASPVRDHGFTLWMASYAMLNFLFAYTILLITYMANSLLRNSPQRAFRAFPALIPLSAIPYAMIDQEGLLAGEFTWPWVLGCCISLVWFCVEQYMERKDWAPTRAICIRCLLSSFILVPIVMSYYVEITPGGYIASARLFTCWILIMGGVLLFMGVSFAQYRNIYS